MEPFLKNYFDQLPRKHTLTVTILIRDVILRMAQFDFGNRHVGEYEFILQEMNPNQEQAKLRDIFPNSISLRLKVQCSFWCGLQVVRGGPVWVPGLGYLECAVAGWFRCGFARDGWVET